MNRTQAGRWLESLWLTAATTGQRGVTHERRSERGHQAEARRCTVASLLMRGPSAKEARDKLTSRCHPSVTTTPMEDESDRGTRGQSRSDHRGLYSTLSQAVSSRWTTTRLQLGHQLTGSALFCRRRAFLEELKAARYTVGLPVHGWRSGPSSSPLDHEVPVPLVLSQVTYH